MSPHERHHEAAQVLAGLDREDLARLHAALARRFGDLQLAEDVVQDAMVAAMTTWPRRGVPVTPVAWLMTTAKRKAIDVLRRDHNLAQKVARLRIEEDLAAPPADEAALASDGLGDDRLSLVSACCHPALRQEERIALTLRFVSGLTTQEVAGAFLVPVATMQQRIVRAKRHIRRTGIPFEVPTPDELPSRLSSVLRVAYLVYTEGYARTSGDEHVSTDLTAEAIRLARVIGRLAPTAETAGLLALLLLTEARRTARTDERGTPIPLPRQDRTRWDRALVTEGLALAERAAGTPGAGSYAIQAAIAAVHAEASSYERTDWEQILVLYGMLQRVEGGPVVALNSAVAAGKAHGPEEGLRRLEALAGEPALTRHRPYAVARAITLGELGRHEDARRAYEAALALPGNSAEQSFIEQEIAQLPAAEST